MHWVNEELRESWPTILQNDDSPLLAMSRVDEASKRGNSLLERTLRAGGAFQPPVASPALLLGSPAVGGREAQRRALRAAPRAAAAPEPVGNTDSQAPADPLRLGCRSLVSTRLQVSATPAPEWKALNCALGAQAHVPHRPSFGFSALSPACPWTRDLNAPSAGLPMGRAASTSP